MTDEEWIMKVRGIIQRAMARSIKRHGPIPNSQYGRALYRMIVTRVMYRAERHGLIAQPPQAKFEGTIVVNLSP